MGENKDYYVYEHIRLDNMTCFYVGKGKNNRSFKIGRNKHHDNIANKHGYAVVIIKDNLTEEEAHWLERYIIEDYVFNLGYNIDIKGYTKKNSKECLTNQTWGGEGSSGKVVSYKTKQILSKKAKLQWKNMSKKELQQYSNKMRKIAFSKPQEEREMMYKNRKYLKGADNPFAREVVCYTLGYEEYFGSTSDAQQKYGILQSNISKCIVNKINHSGYLNNTLPLVWNYKSDYKKMSQSEKNNRIYKAIIYSKIIYCITTNKVFKDIPTAIKTYNLSKYVHINGCCKGKANYAGKLKDGTPLKWCYYINWLKLNEKIKSA